VVVAEQLSNQAAGGAHEISHIGAEVPMGLGRHGRWVWGGPQGETKRSTRRVARYADHARVSIRGALPRGDPNQQRRGRASANDAMPQPKPETKKDGRDPLLGKRGPMARRRGRLERSEIDFPQAVARAPAATAGQAPPVTASPCFKWPPDVRCAHSSSSDGVRNDRESTVSINRRTNDVGNFLRNLRLDSYSDSVIARTQAQISSLQSIGARPIVGRQ
jgi:hypothetical protein